MLRDGKEARNRPDYAVAQVTRGRTFSHLYFPALLDATTFEGGRERADAYSGLVTDRVVAMPRRPGPEEFRRWVATEYDELSRFGKQYGLIK